VADRLELPFLPWIPHKKAHRPAKTHGFPRRDSLGAISKRERPVNASVNWDWVKKVITDLSIFQQGNQQSWQSHPKGGGVLANAQTAAPAALATNGFTTSARPARMGPAT
jgi:hypothetical protein